MRLNYPLMGVMFRSKCKIFLMKEDSVWLIHFQFSVFDQSMLCATDSLKSVLAKKSVRLCGCRHNAFLHHMLDGWQLFPKAERTLHKESNVQAPVNRIYREKR